MTLKLVREERIADGVFGRLYGPATTPLRTMEDDWLNNQPRISCIPAGTYTLRRTIYHKHNYETFEVTGVPGRARILIHPANTEEDVEGCIGVGLRLGTLIVPKDEDTGEMHKLKQAVVESRAAFDRFMSWMVGQDEATLVVEWAPAVAP